MNDLLKQLLAASPRLAVYLGAAGLFGLGVYQFSTGDGENAWKSFSHAVGTLGIGHAATSSPAPNVVVLPTTPAKP